MRVTDHLPAISSFIEQSRESFVADLAALVNRDCGTYNKSGVDAVGEGIAARYTGPTNSDLPSDAQVIGAVQRVGARSDVVVCASGGFSSQ